MLERIDEIISRSYDVACRHGFHDMETSIEHQMMLVVSEIGEMVEADRKNRRADVDDFKSNYRDGMTVIDYDNLFVRSVKDTVEDEMADVVIRLGDICGCFQIDVLQPKETMRDDWNDLFGKYSFTERAYAVVRLLSGCQTGCAMSELSTNIGSALSFLEYWAQDMGVDLNWHIDEKARYNDSRTYKHGKKY